MSTQIASASVRTPEQQIQSRTIQLHNARRDLASAARSLYRASDRGDRTGAARFKRAVEKARQDINAAKESLADLGALL